jgi:hypothetical protein
MENRNHFSKHSSEIIAMKRFLSGVVLGFILALLLWVRPWGTQSVPLDVPQQIEAGDTLLRGTFKEDYEICLIGAYDEYDLCKARPCPPNEGSLVLQAYLPQSDRVWSWMFHPGGAEIRNGHLCIKKDAGVDFQLTVTSVDRSRSRPHTWVPSVLIE